MSEQKKKNHSLGRWLDAPLAFVFPKWLGGCHSGVAHARINSDEFYLRTHTPTCIITHASSLCLRRRARMQMLVLIYLNLHILMYLSVSPPLPRAKCLTESFESVWADHKLEKTVNYLFNKNELGVYPPRSHKALGLSHCDWNTLLRRREREGAWISIIWCKLVK